MTCDDSGERAPDSITLDVRSRSGRLDLILLSVGEVYGGTWLCHADDHVSGAFIAPL